MKKKPLDAALVSMLQKGDAVKCPDADHVEGAFERSYIDKKGRLVVEYRCNFNSGIHTYVIDKMYLGTTITKLKKVHTQCNRSRKTRRAGISPQKTSRISRSSTTLPVKSS